MPQIHTPLVRPPAGHGIERLKPSALTHWRQVDANGFPYNVLHLFEPPRRRPIHRRFRYVLGVDIGDGVGKDCSVCEVVRVGSPEEPEEEVAQFVSPHYAAIQFAYVLQAIGQAYTDQDGTEALVAIETNTNGQSCQDALRLLGYSHFYIRQIEDASNPRKRWMPKIGWQTTRASRGPLLDLFFDGVTSSDAAGVPDLLVNSPATLADMRDFQTHGPLREAEAAGGGRDDCLMALAIGHYVAWHLHMGEQEPVADRRRRLAAKRTHEDLAAAQGHAYDFRTMPFTAEEMTFHETAGAQGEPPPNPDDALTDERALDMDGADGAVWGSQDLL